jgi:hypothetical protein
LNGQTKTEGSINESEFKVNAYDNFNYDQPKAEELLKGFGVVGTHVQDGIARGTGSLIALTTAIKRTDY